MNDIPVSADQGMLDVRQVVFLQVPISHDHG